MLIRRDKRGGNPGTGEKKRGNWFCDEDAAFTSTRVSFVVGGGMGSVQENQGKKFMWQLWFWS